MTCFSLKSSNKVTAIPLIDVHNKIQLIIRNTVLKSCVENLHKPLKLPRIIDLDPDLPQHPNRITDENCF